MEKIVYWILQTKWRKLGVIMLVIVSMAGAVMMIPTKLVLAKMLPGKSANTFTIYIDLPTNSAISQTQMVSECVARHLKREKEVTDIETYLGQGAPLDYAGLVKGSDFKRMKYQAEIVVNLTDKHTRKEPSFMMVHRIRPEIQQECQTMVPGTSIKFIEMPSGPPTLATIVVELYGKDQELMRKTADWVADILRRTPGLVDVDVMHDTIFSKYELVPDKEKILRSALSVEQVNNILYLAFKGMPIAVKNTRNQQDQIPIFVRLSEKSHRFKHNSKEALEAKLSSLKLMNRMGMMIPVKEVVRVEKVPSSPTIFRKNLRDMVTITAECDMVSQVYPLLEARDTMLKELSRDFNVTKDPGISTYMFDLHLKKKRVERRCCCVGTAR